MTKNNPNQTNANQVSKQNQASATSQNQNQMAEEFGSETDVNQVRRQNQQSATNSSHKTKMRWAKNLLLKLMSIRLGNKTNNLKRTREMLQDRARTNSRTVRNK